MTASGGHGEGGAVLGFYAIHCCHTELEMQIIHTWLWGSVFGVGATETAYCNREAEVVILVIAGPCLVCSFEFHILQERSVKYRYF